ncbi:MAG: sulfotransferase family protein [Candidatus Azotimanducaceae bacterium]
MSLRIIGAGFGRTGTLSLKLALEQLGFEKCYHMMEVRNHPDHVNSWRAAARGEPIDWPKLFQSYQAAVDWPSCNFWREQMQAFPDAKVILTLRDSENWYESVMKTIWQVSKDRKEKAANEASSLMVFELIWDGIFSGRMTDKDYVIAQYEKHNQMVIEGVPKHKLLVFEAEEGWSTLCEFLGCSIPETGYPNVNTTKDFVTRLASSN